MIHIDTIVPEIAYRVSSGRLNLYTRHCPSLRPCVPVAGRDTIPCRAEIRDKSRIHVPRRRRRTRGSGDWWQGDNNLSIKEELISHWACDGRPHRTVSADAEAAVLTLQLLIAAQRRSLTQSHRRSCSWSLYTTICLASTLNAATQPGHKAVLWYVRLLDIDSTDINKHIVSVYCGAFH